MAKKCAEKNEKRRIKVKKIDGHVSLFENKCWSLRRKPLSFKRSIAFQVLVRLEIQTETKWDSTNLGGTEGHDGPSNGGNETTSESHGEQGGPEEGSHGAGEPAEEGGGEAAHHKPIRVSEEFRNDSFYQKYSYCMYWSVKMMTSKPYEIANPQTTNEFIFHLFDAFVGILLFASIVGEVDGKMGFFPRYSCSVREFI